VREAEECGCECEEGGCPGEARRAGRLCGCTCLQNNVSGRPAPPPAPERPLPRPAGVGGPGLRLPVPRRALHLLLAHHLAGPRLRLRPGPRPGGPPAPGAGRAQPPPAPAARRPAQDLLPRQGRPGQSPPCSCLVPVIWSLAGAAGLQH
jgi:hypothetical protein